MAILLPHSIKITMLHITRYIWITAILWTIVIIGLLFWNFKQTNQVTQEIAISEARAHFKKDQAFRFWATSHGGVYVPTDDRTPPNPYLIDILDRDIETPSGKKLTLMNPAYMVRQLNEDFSELYGIVGHITSLKPLRPANAPDEWERAALEAFEQGETEWVAFTDIDGVPYLRLIQPMITQEGCLKCHAHQGYEVGDIRGAVGVSLPMTPLLTKQKQTNGYNFLTLGLVWLVGVSGILIGGYKFNQGVNVHNQAVVALQQTNERLEQERSIFISGSVVVFKWKNQEKWPVEYVSSNVEKVLGYTKDLFLRGGIVYADIIHPEDLPQVIHEVEMASKNQKERFEHLPYRIQHPNGKSVWVLDYTTIIRNEENDITHYVGYLVDITAWKETEESLRESEERLALVLQGANLGMWDWNIPTGDVVFNDRWAEMLGYSLSEIEPNMNSWEKLIHPDEISSVMTTLTDHLEGRSSTYQIEHRLRSKTGEWVWVLSRGKVFVRDKEGKPIRATGMHMDITKRKQMEENIVRQERLAAVGQLSAGMAHDFNNILASILLHADLLQQQPDISKYTQKKLSFITTSGKRATKLVRQILDFGRQTMRNPEAIDLAIQLENIVGFLKSTMPENVQVDLQINAGNYMMTGDTNQLQQAITNLTTNACHAMPIGGTLEIILSHIEDKDIGQCAVCYQEIHNPINNQWIQLKIVDYGAGMSANVLPNIFEPFFTTKEIGEGAGLGLSQVAGIVAQHKGHICVESIVGHGSTFTLYLPPLEGNDVSEKILVNTKTKQETSIKYGNGETVLLVEDDAEMAQATTATLNSLNYQVIVVSNGVEALDLIENQNVQVNLVLSNMVMPIMDGITLFHQLKTKKPYIKFILMSKYPLSNEGVTLLKEGALSWLSKPLSLEELSQEINNILLSEKGRWIS